ncbi:MAG: hypothetical protein J0I66_00665, partial [Microbacterium sp.]|nr:hypothetical protein [Microbacterium sp.]
MAKRHVLGAVGGAAALVLLAGCSGGSSTPAESGKVAGTLHILVSSAAASDKAFKDLNAEFVKKYP